MPRRVRWRDGEHRRFPVRGTGASVSANLGGSSKDFWRDLYTWRREVDQGSMSTEFEHGSVGPKPAVKAVKHCCSGPVWCELTTRDTCGDDCAMQSLLILFVLHASPLSPSMPFDIDSLARSHTLRVAKGRTFYRGVPRWLLVFCCALYGYVSVSLCRRRCLFSVKSLASRDYLGLRGERELEIIF